MKYTPEIALGYRDIYLVPNLCTVNTRTACKTEYTFLNKFIFNLPVMPANMQTVIDWKTYERYYEYGVIPVMHRFSNSNIISFLQGVSTPWKAISIGIRDEDITLIDEISRLHKSKWPTCICIDIAHGHSKAVINQIINIRSLLKDQLPFIIAGNVTTPDGVKFLQDAGANMIKVGIGGGHVCSTRHKTGFHVPMFTAIQKCAEAAEVPIIADGGITENGDIAKALVAGADLVMVGSLFAACTDSPALIVDGKKEYYGSASEKNKGYNKNVEGFTVHLRPTMTIKEKVEEIKQDLQSAISYAGGYDLSVLDLSRVQYNIVKS